MTCIVAYDIDDNRIRAKLSRFLENQGVRLQESVFAVEVERHAFRGFTRKVEGLASGSGKVAVFRLCIGCRKNALQLTSGAEASFHVF